MQSRYYDPVVGRFVNSDDSQSVIDIKLSGQNLFVYCQNNSVNLTDFSGNVAWSIILKFFVCAFYGAIGQLASDIIENIYNKAVKKRSGDFMWSPAGDYISSALSYGMCAFDLFNSKLVCFLIPFIPVAVKYITNLVVGATVSWQNLLVDLMAAFVAGIISVYLNKKMKDKLKKVRRGSGNRYDTYAKYLKKKNKITLKINKWFLKISFSIVISTTVKQLLVNLLFK